MLTPEEKKQIADKLRDIPLTMLNTYARSSEDITPEQIEAYGMGAAEMEDLICRLIGIDPDEDLKPTEGWVN